MAEGLNRVMLLGNLGQDPELRMTPNGQAVLRIRLATSESYLDKNRQRQERTEWHSVVIWGKRAEALSKILTKGSRIFVEGGLRSSSYEDREGVKRYRTEIVATNLLLQGGRGRGEMGSHDAPQGNYESSAPAADDGYDDGNHGAPPADDDIPF